MLSDLAREEELERADPLRHYMAQDQDALLPPQKLLSSETTRRAFRDQLGIRTVEIELMTDPSPGCGGVAWAAGEVFSPSTSSLGRL
jgi:protein N-lysine methyltransferase METTL21A